MRFTLRKKKPLAADLKIVPRHVALIMDGNGRWAKQRGLPRIAGHRKGADTLRNIVQTCDEFGVDYLTVYAFSSENWARPQDEVDALMRLLEKFLTEHTQEMMEKNVRLNAIGDFTRLPEQIQSILKQSITTTSENTGVTLTLALSYGSRDEILHATRQLAQQAADGTLTPSDIDAETFSQSLYTKNLPDPDLLIRTSGECRLSNFLLWQLSYAEIVITDTKWPAFGREDFLIALLEYNKRDRRYGKLDDNA